MQYDANDLRVADLLALILVGLGFVVGILGIVLARTYWVPCGVVLVCLGFALSIKIRRIEKNGRHEDE